MMVEENQKEELPGAGFVMPVKWVIIAIVIFMLIYNALLYLGATGDEADKPAAVVSEQS